MNRRGRPPYPDILTPREWEVLGLVERGYTNDEIATRLGISIGGVKFHVSEILGKLHLSSRDEAARWHRERVAPAPLWAPLLFLLPSRWGGKAVPALGAAALAAALGGLAAVGIAVSCATTDNSAADVAEVSTATAPFTRPANGFVFVEHDEATAWPDGTWRVSVFDADRMAVVASFDLPGDEPQVALAGDRVIVNRGDRIASYALDGSDERRVRQAPTSGGIAAFDVSPDGRTMAVGEMTSGCCPGEGRPGSAFFEYFGRIVLIDLESLRILQVLPHSAPGLDALRGWLSDVQWFGDGSALAVRSEVPRAILSDGTTTGTDPGATAIVRIDGTSSLAPSVVNGGFDGAPDGRYVLAGETRGPCPIGEAPLIEAAIYDLQSGTVVTFARGIGDTYWSPDGSELLYAAVDAAIDAVGPTEPCARVTNDTARWSVVHTDGSPPEIGVDPAAIMDGWYGDRRINYTCDEQGDDPWFHPSCAFGLVDAEFRGQTIATAWIVSVIGWLD